MKLYFFTKKCLDYILFLKSVQKNRACITLLYVQLKYQELSEYKGIPLLQRHTCITTMKSCTEYIRTSKRTYLTPKMKDPTYRGKNGNCVSSSHRQTVGII